MDVTNIASLSRLQQYQTLGGPDSRQYAGQSPTANAKQMKNEQTDQVEISPEGMAAYKKKQAEESPEYRTAILELATIEKKVLAHEQAHMSAGGDLAGSASYSYTVGPDGKRYISGGEVPISMPASDDKEQMLKDLEQVKKAALAPAEPSSQDQKVAAEASAKQMKLRGEIAAEKDDKGLTDHQ